MGLYQFRLPDVGEGIAEAEIVEWRVKPGDVVKEDDPLLDVMTDKATIDITSPVSGKVLATFGEVGKPAPVGSVLVELEVEGAGNVAAAEQSAEPAAPNAGAPLTNAAFAPASSQSAPLAAPATRKRAQDLGIDLAFVRASGPNGRITTGDLDAYIAAQSGGALEQGVHEQKVVGLRRKIAEKMEAAHAIPQLGYVEEFDLTALEDLRKELNAKKQVDQPKLTLLPFLMRGIVLLRPEFPSVNARYDSEAGVLRLYDSVHIGIAAQTPNGLMVPVVRNVETLSLWDMAREITRLAAAARDGRASREELSGSTITITSLGAVGGIATMPIINAPEVGIIGPNKLEDRPVVRDGQVVIRTMMNVSSAFDHRIVDGYDAALFVQGLKRLMENPPLLFVGREDA